MARTNNFVLEEPEQSMPIIEKGFKKLLPLKGWGNARDVSKLYESVCEYRAQRLRNDRAQGNETYLEKICLKEDITMAMDAMISAGMGTGGAHRKADTHADPFAELNQLYRVEKVKGKLQQLQNTYIIANLMERTHHLLATSFSQDLLELEKTQASITIINRGIATKLLTPTNNLHLSPCLHAVARVMSNILFDLELTACRHVEETNGLKLQGQYLGQTQKVVESILDKAKGGLLFIDESYMLGQEMFGSEACDTLVAAMTDPQYAGLVVVIAGYPKDIDDMLARNAGLKSRFTHTLEFPDWEDNDCVEYFLERAKMKGFRLPTEELTFYIEDSENCMLWMASEMLEMLIQSGKPQADSVQTESLLAMTTGNCLKKGICNRPLKN